MGEKSLLASTAHQISNDILFGIHYLSQKSRIYYLPPSLAGQEYDSGSCEIYIADDIVSKIEYSLKSDKNVPSRLMSFFYSRKKLLLSELERQVVLLNQSKFSHFIPFTSSKYPPLLRCIKDPPLGLYCLGNLSLLGKPMVSVVGARKASRESLHFSQTIGYQLSMLGFTTTSGGALGCDIYSHKGVLRHNQELASAIIVMPSSLDYLVPRYNQQVFDDLLKRNALFLSERPFGSPCIKVDFIIRNRIISGLSLDLVLVEAAQRSGALSTARFAADNGRNVYVWYQEGFENDIRKAGGVTLIQDGAMPFDRFESLRLKLMSNRESNLPDKNS